MNPYDASGAQAAPSLVAEPPVMAGVFVPSGSEASTPLVGSENTVLDTVPAISHETPSAAPAEPVLTAPYVEQAVAPPLTVAREVTISVPTEPILQPVAPEPVKHTIDPAVWAASVVAPAPKAQPERMHAAPPAIPNLAILEKKLESRVPQGNIAMGLELAVGRGRGRK